MLIRLLSLLTTINYIAFLLTALVLDINIFKKLKDPNHDLIDDVVRDGGSRLAILAFLLFLYLIISGISYITTGRIGIHGLSRKANLSTGIFVFGFTIASMALVETQRINFKNQFEEVQLQRARERKPPNINVQITTDFPCSLDTPFLTTITNKSNTLRIQKINFYLYSKIRGHSEIYSTIEISTDKIINPNESHEMCIGAKGSLYFLQKLNEAQQDMDLELFINNVDYY